MKSFFIAMAMLSLPVWLQAKPAKVSAWLVIGNPTCSKFRIVLTDESGNTIVSGEVWTQEGCSGEPAKVYEGEAFIGDNGTTELLVQTLTENMETYAQYKAACEMARRKPAEKP